MRSQKKRKTGSNLFPGKEEGHAVLKKKRGTEPTKKEMLKKKNNWTSLGKGKHPGTQKDSQAALSPRQRNHPHKEDGKHNWVSHERRNVRRIQEGVQSMPHL